MYGTDIGRIENSVRPTYDLPIVEPNGIDRREDLIMSTAETPQSIDTRCDASSSSSACPILASSSGVHPGIRLSPSSFDGPGIV
ncbi:hypothetical protein JNW88_11005 [Micromonospora sp. ATA32]|nr:hypothetical protein [Micromonospora sp. ATA32]